jgi:diguanylate cyclase (GGDEF)-like protein/PAS domain S-box-containing protein
LEIISDGVWDWNANTGDVYRSPGWYIMLGYDVDSLEGSVFSWENVIHPEDYARVMEHFESYITNQIDHYKIRYRCRTKTGDYINIEDRGRIVEWNPDGTVARMIGAHRNVDSDVKLSKQQALETKTLQDLVDSQTRELLEINSQLSKLNSESKRLATTDSLTSLANRYWFEQKLHNESERCKRFNQHLTLIAFDLDKFKPVNDTYGHAAGDLVLRSIAKILHENVREIDTPARWGGDEFMLLLPNTSLDQAEKLAEKIQQLINEEMSKQNLSVTASFGVAELKKSETPTRFTIRADNAMYDSKKLGGNRITISR